MSHIIGFRTPDRIVLAADSMSQTATATSRDLARGECSKLHIADRWAFATDGFAIGPDGLNVAAVLRDAIAPAQTIADALLSAAAIVERRIIPSAAKARRFPAFAELFGARNGLLAVLIGGKEPDGRLAFAWAAVNIDTTGPDFRWEMIGGTCPSPKCGDEARVFQASGQDPTASLIAYGPRPDWLERGDVDAAWRIMAMQVDATPDRVGGDIQVLEITQEGRKWHGNSVEHDHG